MIKLQVNDKNYNTSDAVNIVLKRTLKVFKAFTLVATILEYTIYIALACFIWWLSAWTHEGDIIEACKAGKPVELFHDGVVVECKIKDH